MILSDFIARVADDAGVTSSVTTTYNRLLRETNRIGEEVWNGYQWSFRQRNYRIVTDVDVTAGTVSLTNGSRVVTGTSTAFASSHVTWHIYFPGDSIANWYKVRKFTSTTSIELDVPYQGTTGSGKTYVLRHFDYVLPTEPWDIGSVMVTHQRKSVPIVDSASIDILGAAPLYNGYPEAVAIYSSDTVPTVYSTGTVTGTADTTILTGSGTLWLDNIYPGDLVTIGAYNYTVRRVDTDTQITLYNNQQIASAGATYTITRQFGRILRVMWPSNLNYVLDIRAYRMYAPLVHANDTNELLYRMPNALSLKIAALELKAQGDRNARQYDVDATLGILNARAEDEAGTQKQGIAPIYSYRSTGYNRESIR